MIARPEMRKLGTRHTNADPGGRVARSSSAERGSEVLREKRPQLLDCFRREPDRLALLTGNLAGSGTVWVNLEIAVSTFVVDD
jgi:hypothetical protein